ncbi:hypothetical protein DPEC_G00361080 [Dallia pectoralis]|uniref:Uncharacterized protein n=1 Tax=Dallia pectoralis TaxID=75939 RepID=A0ACC2F129_DALPE|nr:hypothetical protein DPEC_G00361080 [Dallia pectoralis]
MICFPINYFFSSAESSSQHERDRRILISLEEIKVQLRQHTLLLQALSRKPAEETEELNHQFPLKSQEDLLRLESDLNDKAAQRALTNKLSSIGGMNSSDVVRRILRHISDELALGFNWAGRGSESPFSTLKITTVIKDQRDYGAYDRRHPRPTHRGISDDESGVDHPGCHTTAAGDSDPQACALGRGFSAELSAISGPGNEVTVAYTV